MQQVVWSTLPKAARCLLGYEFGFEESAVDCTLLAKTTSTDFLVELPNGEKHEISTDFLIIR